jgi:hypothetical protein
LQGDHFVAIIDKISVNKLLKEMESAGQDTAQECVQTIGSMLCGG